jgi:type II secretory pathway component PulF
MMWQVFHPGRWDDSYVRDIWDTMLWLIPGGRGYLRDKGLADVCAVSADALEAGRPLQDALLEVSQVQLPPPVRARVNEWRHGVESGLPAEEAAQRARMPKLFVAMVKTGVATGDLPAAMRFLSRYYRGRFSRAGEVVRGAFIPVLVLVMGVVVLGVALSLFMPLMDMIEAASPYREVWP